MTSVVVAVMVAEVSDDNYSRKGVRLDVMCSLLTDGVISSDGSKAFVDDPQNATAQHVADALVKPFNGSGKATFIDLLQPEFVSPADHKCAFLSHAWS